jgi:Holliday junction DNA helicase RuvA
MITKITGVINRVLDEEIRLQVGSMEYQVLVPEFVRRILQHRHGEEITLHTSEYLESNQTQSRMVPRLIGFLHEIELDFFELFCTVDKVGVRKAMKALVRPIREIADAIQRQDSKWLTSLPGIGPATAEQVVATLRRKVTRFAFADVTTLNGEDRPATPAGMSGNLIEDAYQALVHLGLSPQEARERLDKVLVGGKTFDSVQEIIQAIFQKA